MPSCLKWFYYLELSCMLWCFILIVFKLKSLFFSITKKRWNHALYASGKQTLKRSEHLSHVYMCTFLQLQPVSTSRGSNYQHIHTYDPSGSTWNRQSQVPQRTDFRDIRPLSGLLQNSTRNVISIYYRICTKIISVQIHVSSANAYQLHDTVVE